jgi:glucuronate isomerase
VSQLHPGRLFPCSEPARGIARELHAEIEGLPIVSPHGHTDPAWFALNRNFSDAASLFLTPDHYVLRMLRSQGIDYEFLGLAKKGETPKVNGPEAWRLFARNYHLFAATPSRLWIDHALHWAFGIEEELDESNAGRIYERITAMLQTDEMKPMAVLDRANVEVIATTEFALDPLAHHGVLKAKGLTSRIRTTYRPDDVTDPAQPGFAERLLAFGEFTGEDVARWKGMIAAHARRRASFRDCGATATDHGVPDALTLDLPAHQKQALLDKALKSLLTDEEKRMFRAQMMTEMAALSVDDGMVMQIHAGSQRNTDPALLASYGPNLGADIPGRAEFVQSLAPLLTRFGTAKTFRLILFTLDESAYARELAPMAGYWPCLLIGPPWWFHDSPQGIRRYLDQVVETAGFHNLAGFNDDTRALLSIPARHDVWRREICRFLAGLVAEHRLSMATARGVAKYMAYDAAKAAYRL